MNNPLRPVACEILDIKKESLLEYTFKVKTDIVPTHGQFLQLSIPKVGEAPISVSAYGDGWMDFTIRSVGKVTDAVKGVADTITSWLHFSRPDVGPLREYEKWMPDFMSGLAKGIRDNKWKVEDELSSLSNDMSYTINANVNKSLEYNNTIETVIQSKIKGLHILSVPIRVNSCYRKSRLVKNIFTYVQKNSFTILRMFIIYRPFRFFAAIGSFISFVGLILLSRFLFLYFLDHGNGHIQSLIISSILVITGIQIIIFGVLSDLLAINRKLVEDIQVRVKKMENK